MSKPLSLDLRTRVLAAIWRALERTQGDAKAKAIGGDRRSERMERHGDAIRSLVAETPDITLEEIRTALAARGVSASYGALWRFLRRHKITRKKDRARGGARSPGYREAPRGQVRRASRSRSGAPGLHRRNLGFNQHAAPSWAGPERPAAAGRRPARTLENHDVCRRLAHQWHGRAYGP